MWVCHQYTDYMLMMISSLPTQNACVSSCWAITTHPKFRVSYISSLQKKKKTYVKRFDLLSLRATANGISVDDLHQKVDVVNGSESTSYASSVSIFCLPIHVIHIVLLP